MSVQNINALDECLKKISYTNHARVRSDVLEVMTKLQTLYPKIGSISFTNGVKKQLLNLYGTIPMYYRGTKYNIPMNFWIPELYPQHAPMTFVSPTDNMIIKPKHRHVDTQGRCYSPYLSRWNAGTCNLYGLVNDLSTLFNEDPPVYQKPPTTTTTTTNTTPSSSMNMPNIPSATPTPPTNSDSHYPYNRYNATPSPFPATPSFLSPKTDRDALLEKVREKVPLYIKDLQEKVDNDTQVSIKLTARSKELADEELRLDRELPTLIREVNALKEREANLDKWIDTHEKRDMDVDKMIEPEDMHSRQVLELLAEDNAIDDLVWVLGEALDKKTISTDTYLTRVRQLARDQFMKRALLLKLSYKF